MPQVLSGPQDAALKKTFALPNGAAAAQSAAIELPQTSTGQFVADHECLLSVPALNATQLPNSKTMIYSVETAIDSAFTSPIVVYAEIARHTGGGGVGDATVIAKRFRLPSDVKQFVRVKATGSASGDATTATATVSIKGF